MAKWIDRSIDISSFYDRLSDDLKELIEEAELAEKEENEGKYMALCDSIEVIGKLHVTSGHISEYEWWNMLCSRYFPRELGD